MLSDIWNEDYNISFRFSSLEKSFLPEDNSLKKPRTACIYLQDKICIEADFWLESCDRLVHYSINNQIKRMKKMIIFIGFVAFFSSAYSSTSLTYPSAGKLPLRADEVYLPVGTTGRLISMMD